MDLGDTAAVTVVVGVLVVALLGVLFFAASRWTRRRVSQGAGELATLTGRHVIVWCQVPRRWRASVAVSGTVETVTPEHVDLATDVEALSSPARRFVLYGRLVRIPLASIDEVACEGRTIHLHS